MFKAIILLTRGADQSPADFRHWWLEHHAPLARQLPGLRGLTFNLVAPDLNGPEDPPYDGVSELSAQTKAQWESLGFSDAEFLGDIGLKDGFGERGRSTLERTWSRPTCDVNGIFGGYTGKGAKTVIAAHATAKVSFRLVSRQDPAKIAAAFEDFVRSRLPAGCRAEFESHGANSAIEVSESSRYLAAANKGLHDVFGKAPLLIGTGGSIPAVGSIQRTFGNRAKSASSEYTVPPCS